MSARDEEELDSEDAAFESLLAQAARASDIPLRSLSTMLPLQPGASLLGGRFRILRRLGSGAMGMVYEAEDLERPGPVALKMLSRADPVSVLRFKNEFRSLADAVHPRLVRLHALFNQGTSWFFTMDLIDGLSFSEHAAALGAAGTPERARACDAWLRTALVDICDGVLALHQIGKLHRDLKPSNVLVATDGHVTIVDFGLVTEARSAAGSPASVSGTRAYLAPERRLGQAASQASDWYAVGVMLFEALTEEQPEMHAHASAVAKLAHAAPDLARICLELLSASPETRLHGAALRARLASARPAAAATPHRESSTFAPVELTFVGREQEQARLEAALLAVRSGRTVVCRIRGPSGFGKTTLVRHFVLRAQAEHSAVALVGRCYESEHIPYKLLDGVVDALASQLAQISGPIAFGIPAPQLAALVRLFPVLRGAPMIQQIDEAADDSYDGAERRRRALIALRALLGCVAPAHPLIVHVDDAQWADPDGTQLLALVLESARPLLLVLSHRDEEENPSLARLFHEFERQQRSLCDLTLEGLALPELERLCRAAGEASDSTVDLIMREADGSPYFALELVRTAFELVPGANAPAAHSSNPSVHGGTLALHALIQRRAAALPADALAALRTITIAGAPIERSVLCEAVTSSDIDRALALLRSGRFARTVQTQTTQLLTTYHDRVRDAVAQSLNPEQRRVLQLRLAIAIESSCPEEIELIATHFAGAGELARAAPFARLAGDRAKTALAFERAAEWFRLALSADCWPNAETQQIAIEFAGALALAGHAAEAADAYLQAAEAAADDDARSLFEIQAAAQWLCSGRLEQGVDLLRYGPKRRAQSLPAAEHLRSFGKVSAGRSPSARDLGNFARAQPEALELTMRMLCYTGKSAVGRESGARCDAWYWASLGAIGLEVDDLSAYLVFRQLLEAMRCGDAFRIARGAHLAAAMGSAPQSYFATRMSRFSAKIAARAERHSDDPRLAFFRENRLAWQAFFGFDPEQAVQHAEAALQLARDGHGVERELTLLQLFTSHSPMMRGDIAEYTERLNGFRADGERRRDDFVAAWSVVADRRWLITSDHLTRVQSLEALRAQLEPRGSLLLNLVVQLDMELALAERAGGAVQNAFDRMRHLLSRARTAGTWNIAPNRALVLGQTVAATLALSANMQPRGERTALLRWAESLLDESPAPKSWSAVHRAAIAYQRGQLERAQQYLETVVSTTNTTEGVGLTVSAQRTLGLLRGDDQMVRDSEARLRALFSTADPEYLAVILVAGIPQRR